MAFLLDGVQAVRYTAPKPASTPVRYTASTMLNTQQQTAANRYQAQADAYKKQQQEAARRAEAQRLAQQAAQYQQQQRNAQINQQRTPVTNNLTPRPVQPPPTNLLQMQQQQRQPVQTGPATMNMGSQNLSSQAQPDRWATVPQTQQLAQAQQSPTRPYHPVTNPIGYRDDTVNMSRYLQNTYGMDWRQQPQFSSILMNSKEWLQRRAAWEKNYGNIFVSQDEWTRRNNAAPPGYMWTPFGSSYARLNTAPQTTPTNTGGSYAGGGGYYTNPPNYSGGGGAGYTPKPPEWWVEMVNWRI